MSITEAARLAVQCDLDVGSHIHAARRDWRYPAPLAALALMDVFDLLSVVNTPKRSTPTTYPRPWEQPVERIARPAVSQDVVRAALREAGHTNLPD